MDDEMHLPVIRWHEGMTFPQVRGHAPSFIEVDDGAGHHHVVDESRWYWICHALLTTHPESERLLALVTERPGLEIQRQREEDAMVVVAVATGEPIGLFDPRLLDATLTPGAG